MIVGSRRNILINVPSGSSERKHSITISNAQVSGTGNLTDFPVLITLDHLDTEVVDAGANSAQNGGADIIFTSDEAGTTRLSCEIVNFVTNAIPANRKCQIWVKVPTLSGSSDTTIWIWYKNAVRTQPAAGEPFGSQSVWSNYSFMSHDGITDSTGNFTIVQDVPAGTIEFLDANVCNFDGADSHYVDISTLDLQTLGTIGCWANQPSAVTANRIMHFAGGTNIDTIKIGTGTSGAGDFIGGASSAITGIASANSELSGNYTPGTWVKCNLNIFDMPGNSVNFITNGVSATLAGAGYTGGTNTNRLTLGSRADKANFFTGYAGHFYFSTNIFSDDYMITEFNNQNSASTFASPGTPINDTF